MNCELNTDIETYNKIREFLEGRKGFVYGQGVNEFLGIEMFCDFDMLSLYDNKVMINYDN